MPLGDPIEVVKPRVTYQVDSRWIRCFLKSGFGVNTGWIWGEFGVDPGRILGGFWICNGLLHKCGGFWGGF